MATLTASIGTPVDYATEAFCNAYSHFGDVPMPERARTALRASQGLFNEHQGPSALAVIEAKATLEGLYAQIYARRDRLWMKYDRRSKNWAARLALDVPYDAILTDIKAVTTTEVHEATAKQRADIRKDVLAALIDTLTRYSDLAAEARSMAAAAQAEGSALGMTAAAALLAYMNGHPIPDMDTLQQQSLTQLQKELSYGIDANDIVTDMLGGLAGDIAQSSPPADQSDNNLTLGLQATVGAGVGAAFYLDHHIHSAFALAMLAAYKRAGENVLFVTVGDDRVCPSCLAAEDGNPYTPENVPPIPFHGSCRCWYSPA